MKRIVSLLVILMAFAVAYRVAYTNATEVKSVNAVGYMKVFVPSGGYAFVSMSLEPVGVATTMTVVSSISNQLPNGSRVYIWDRTDKTWKITQKNTFGVWSTPYSTTNLLRGDGFFLQIPVGTVTTGAMYQVTLMGQVPDSVSDNTTTVSKVFFDGVGYPYPTEILFTNTTLAKYAPTSSRLYMWNLGQQKYDVYTKSSLSGWNTANSIKLLPGQAFFMQLPSVSTNWIENVRYDLYN